MKRSLLRFPSLLALHLLPVAGLAFALARTASPPQLAQGEDALAVVFGDAREVISRAAVHKADSYFHGGVDMACEECHHHHEHAHPERETENAERGNGNPDPWHWINSHVRAPEVDRHLSGTKAVEMMPWLWASVKTDPHNITAWTAAWYTAAHVMKDGALAQRILDEGKAKNPDSAELWFTEGRFLYKMGEGDARRALVSFKRARELLLKACGNDVSRLSESDRQLYAFNENFIRKIAAP